MKNFGLLLLGIILGALAMYFYCYNNEVEMTSVPPLNEPKGLIKPKAAMALDSAYNVKYRIINDSLFRKSLTGDNRSVWFSLDEIQNYILYADAKVGEKGFIMDGLRIYLGSYPDVKGKIGLTTMFFVPTGYKDPDIGNRLRSADGKGSNDIQGVDGLNFGQGGEPPGANYPE